jgi:hypothetical protein
MKTPRKTDLCRLHTPLAGVLMLLVTASTLGVVASLAGQETTVEGVVHVQNPAVPPGGVETLKLKEMWRVGGEDDEIFFGVVAQILQDETGNFYILDGQLSQVQVYSPTGEFLKSLSREGEGPGEVRRPGDMFFLPDGTLGLVQSFPGKVVKIDLEGIPAGTMKVGGADPNQGRFGVLVAGRAQDEVIVLTGFNMNISGPAGMDQSFYLSRCDATGRELFQYITKEYPIDYGSPEGWVLDEAGIDFVWSGRFALGPKGHLYMAPSRDEYVIHILNPDGSLQRVVERDYEGRKRTDEELQETRLNLEAVGRNYPLPPRDVTCEGTEAVISGLFITEDGELWVANSNDNRDPDEGVLSIFDVFDSNGQFQKKIQVEGPGDPNRDALYFPGPNRAMVVTGALDAFRSMQGVASEQAETEEEELPPLEVICLSFGE